MKDKQLLSIYWPLHEKPKRNLLTVDPSNFHCYLAASDGSLLLPAKHYILDSKGIIK
ncbi:MAG TPA: hypothetical protein VI278_10835 [Nitrososphaeraceae archaeon]